MIDERRSLGTHGEALARQHLESLGYSFREANYRCPSGEMDLIMEDGPCLVFVEVRTRRSRNAGTPEESITARKKERLRAIAHTYLQAHEDSAPECWRIDVVAIELTPPDALVRLEHLKYAVEGE